MFEKKRKMDFAQFGYSVISKNVLEGKGKIKWCIREEPKNKFDNGWVFLSEVDTDEFLSSPDSMTIISWEDLMKIDSFLIVIYNMPIGTDMYIEVPDEKGNRHFFDTETGKMLL